MNWEAIGAIGEIIGALAVVISLVYLGLQIRNQNKETRVSSIHDILEALRHEISAFKVTENAQLYAAGNENFDTLSDAEKIQYISLGLGPLRVWEEAYYQYQDGRLDERTWEGLIAQIGDILAMPGPAKVWSIRKHTFSSDFVTFVDALKNTHTSKSDT